MVPGRQPIGCLLTVAIGISGSIAGWQFPEQPTSAEGFLILLRQVAVAAVGVALVAAAMRDWRRPPRGM